MLSVMNNTKREELCLEMLELKASSPQWRTKDLTTGFYLHWVEIGFIISENMALIRLNGSN